MTEMLFFFSEQNLELFFLTVLLHVQLLVTVFLGLRYMGPFTLKGNPSYSYIQTGASAVMWGEPTQTLPSTLRVYPTVNYSSFARMLSKHDALQIFLLLRSLQCNLS